MDIRYDHGSEIQAVRANCDDAPDLIAVGGVHSVQVLLTVSHQRVPTRIPRPREYVHVLNSSRQTPTSCRVIANFYIGTRITALAWSTRCTSPSNTDEWSIECVLRPSTFTSRVVIVNPSRLAAAGANFGLYLLTKSHEAEEDVFAFGGGLSGHHGKVNDMAFCGGQSEDSWRYVATVSGTHTQTLIYTRAT